MNTQIRQYLWLIGAAALYLSVAILTALNISSWAPPARQANNRMQNQPAVAISVPGSLPTRHTTSATITSNTTTKQRTSAVLPRLGKTDRTPDQQPHVFQSPPVQDFPPTALGQQLMTHFDLMASQGPGTEEH